MFPCVQNHCGGPLDRLRGELDSQIARQAHANTPVGQRLDQHEDVRGAATAHTGQGCAGPPNPIATPQKQGTKQKNKKRDEPKNVLDVQRETRLGKF